MNRPSLAELSARCQKLQHDRIGNWFARRISRPLALRVTWFILPTGISANRVTVLAIAFAVAATCCLSLGTPLGLVFSAVLLQAWYLLDHVDGQLARYHRVASLDGVQLDYLMHHLVNLLLPIGWGHGMGRYWEVGEFKLVGLLWGIAQLTMGLVNDTRYKAFVQRLKLVEGDLVTVGGGGGTIGPPAPPPRFGISLARYFARKCTEIHVVMNVLLVLAVMAMCLPQWAMLVGTLYLLLGGVAAGAVALGSIVRSQSKGDAEREFALWFRPPPGMTFEHHDGKWYVRPNRASEALPRNKIGAYHPPASPRSS